MARFNDKHFMQFSSRYVANSAGINVKCPVCATQMKNPTRILTLAPPPIAKNIYAASVWMLKIKWRKSSLFPDILVHIY